MKHGAYSGFYIHELGGLSYINTAKTAFEVDNKDIYNITAQTILKDGTTTTAVGLEVGNELSVGDRVKVEGNVITRIAKAADISAAVAVDALIADLSIADETAPTAAEKAAIANARAAYDGLTAAQKALVTKLADLEALEAIIEAADAPALAVKAVVDAVAANDTLALSEALANPLFKNVVRANMAAYITNTAFTSLTATSTVADVNAAIVTVNNEVIEKAAVKAVVDAVAANDTLALSEALANPLFENVVRANMAAYIANTAFTSLTATSTVADVNAAIVTVNNEEDVKAAKAALTNTSLTIVDPTADPVVVNAPAAASGINYYITSATDTNVTTTGAGASATSVSIARHTTDDGSTVLELTITKGAITDTVTYTVTVPAGTAAATIVKN